MSRGEHCKNFTSLYIFLAMFIKLEDKILNLKVYDNHGTYLSVQMKRKQMQIVKIMNWTAIVFFLPHLSITNTVANMPVIKKHYCADPHMNNYNKDLNLTQPLTYNPKHIFFCDIRS